MTHFPVTDLAADFPFQQPESAGSMLVVFTSMEK